MDDLFTLIAKVAQFSAAMLKAARLPPPDYEDQAGWLLKGLSEMFVHERMARRAGSPVRVSGIMCLASLETVRLTIRNSVALTPFQETFIGNGF